MNNAGLVRGHQRRSDLDGNLQRFIQCQGCACQKLAQRLAFDELGGDEAQRVCLAELVNGQNVRMV